MNKTQSLENFVYLVGLHIYLGVTLLIIKGGPQIKELRGVGATGYVHHYMLLTALINRPACFRLLRRCNEGGI